MTEDNRTMILQAACIIRDLPGALAFDRKVAKDLFELYYVSSPEPKPSGLIGGET